MQVQSVGIPRWWDVAVGRFEEMAEEVVPGKWDYWTQYDQETLKIQSTCPAMIPFRVAEIAPGWVVDGIVPGVSNGIDDDVF